MDAVRRQVGSWLGLPPRSDDAPATSPVYDAWLHFGTADVCNLRCTYCISDSAGFPAPKRSGGKIDAIDIDRTLRTLDDSGRTYKIVFAGGGEPLLIPNFVDACVALTRKHYVALHSNLTLPQPVRDLVERVIPDRVLYINASLHIDELERTGFMERFLDCFKRLQAAEFPVSVHAVAHPDLLPGISELTTRLQGEGIRLILDPFLGTHEGRTYPDAYTEEQCRELGLGDLSIFRTKGKICNAGFNVGLVLANGDVRFCSEVGTKIGNIYERIDFRDQVTTCPSECCRCPYYAHDSQLFRAATVGTVSGT